MSSSLFGNLTDAQTDAIAAAGLERLIGRRSGFSRRTVALSTSFIQNSEESFFSQGVGWVAGVQELPPDSKESTRSRGGPWYGDTNSYYMDLGIDLEGLPAGWAPSAPGVADYWYATRSGAGGIITATASLVDDGDTLTYHRLDLHHQVVLTTVSAVWGGAGVPAVGSPFSVTAATKREAGAYKAIGVVFASSAGSTTFVIHNGGTLADGDTIAAAGGTFTINTGGGDVIGSPNVRVPGQEVTWAGATTGTFTIGDKVTAPSGHAAIVTRYDSGAKTLWLTPMSSGEFVVGEVLTNASQTGASAALTVATWDTIVATNAGVYNRSITLGPLAVFKEGTWGTLRTWNDPARPTVLPQELGHSWPLGAVGPQFADRRYMRIQLSSALHGWLVGQHIRQQEDPVGGFGQADGKIVAVAGDTLDIVPIAGALTLGGFMSGGTVENIRVPGPTYTILPTLTGWPRNFWPGVAADQGVCAWRRGIPIPAGHLGRRGGALLITLAGRYTSVLPAGETNILELIIGYDIKYASEFGGLKEIPTNQRLGWRIEVPAAANGIFWAQIECRAVHPQTQIWSGRILMSPSVFGEFVDYPAVVGSVDKPLLPIYRAFTAGARPPRPEERDCNLSVMLRCDGTAGGGVHPPQAFGTVGVATTAQLPSPTRLMMAVFHAHAEAIEAN